MRRSTPYTAADDDQLRREQRLFLLRVPDALIGRTKLSVADLHLPKMNSERLLAEAGLRALVRDRMQDQTELVKRVSSQAEFDAAAKFLGVALEGFHSPDSPKGLSDMREHALGQNGGLELSPVELDWLSGILWALVYADELADDGYRDDRLPGHNSD